MKQVLWAVVPVIIGAIIGFCSSEAKDWLERRRRNKAHWAALSAEVNHCSHLAQTYLADRVDAPSYRLPTISYSKLLPDLLAGGGLTEKETRSVIQFYVQVESLNRGIDLAQDARGGSGEVMKQEVGRNLLKAAELVPGSGERRTYFDEARATIDHHL